MTKGTLSTDRDQLTVQDVAHELGVDAATVSGWLASGELAGYRLPSRWLIMADDLQAFLTRGRQVRQARGGSPLIAER